jgi:Nickel/cobalt transporter regulator
MNQGLISSGSNSEEIVVSKLIIALGALALAAAPMAALADHHGPGKAQGVGPGKPHPHGMPPGQAKKLWRQGERLPMSYVTQSSYYVANPSQYNLAAAPPGYRWVLVDGRYYLTQTRTGLIAQVISELLR